MHSLSQMLRNKKERASLIVAGTVTLALVVAGIALAQAGLFASSMDDDTNDVGLYGYSTFDMATYNDGDIATEDANLPVGKIRVVKNAAHWNWPEYGTTPTEGITPEALPIYNEELVNPYQYNHYSSVSEGILSQAKNVPGIPGVVLRVSCSGNKGYLDATDQNGYLTINRDKLAAVGCGSTIDISTITVSRPTANVNLKSASYLYNFANPSLQVIPMTTSESYVKSIMTGFRPSILGRLSDETGNAIPNAQICLFYREPQDNEPCNKEHLSVNGQTDSTGHFTIYASWGDYAAKGAQATAQLVVETTRGRMLCGNPFRILGDRATIQHCQIDRTAGVSYGSSEMAVGETAGTTRFGQSSSQGGTSGTSANRAVTVSNSNRCDSNTASTASSQEKGNENQYHSTNQILTSGSKIKQNQVMTATRPSDTGAAQPTTQPRFTIRTVITSLTNTVQNGFNAGNRLISYVWNGLDRRCQ